MMAFYLASFSLTQKADIFILSPTLSYYFFQRQYIFFIDFLVLDDCFSSPSFKT